MTVPMVRNPCRRIACIAQLQAPDAVDLDGCDSKLGLDTPALQVLQQRNAVEHQRARKVDRVDSASLAGSVHARRARGEGAGHTATLAACGRAAP